ncbi:MAG: hypothetical protein V9E83_03850 [Baekduia sp.]
MRHLLAAAFVLAGLAGPAAATAAAGWSEPATVPGSERGAFPSVASSEHGTVVLNSGLSRVTVVPRTADGFGPAREAGPGDPFEQVLGTALAANGDTTVISERKRPRFIRRVRVTLTSASGSRLGPMTISDRAHSAQSPVLSVAPDGTTVAAWWGYAPGEGWTPQAAVRLPGEPRFAMRQQLASQGRAGRLTGYDMPRAVLRAAAANGGRAAVAWGFTSTSTSSTSSIGVAAASGGRFSPSGSFSSPTQDMSELDLSLSNDGQLLVDYIQGSGYRSGARSTLMAASARIDRKLPEFAAVATGDTSGCTCRLLSAFTEDGRATIGWTPRANANPYGGPLLVVTRQADGTFSPAETLAPDTDSVDWVDVQPGPDGSTAISWRSRLQTGAGEVDTQRLALRPRGSSSFEAPVELPSTASFGLPSVASLTFTSAGDALAVWSTDSAPGVLGPARYSVLSPQR